MLVTRVCFACVFLLACGDDTVPPSDLDGGADAAVDASSDDASSDDAGGSDGGDVAPSPDATVPDGGADVVPTPDAATSGPEDNDTTCQDGIDNDRDGDIDCDDEDCQSNVICPESMVRIVAANLTSGGGTPSYDAGHGVRIMDGLDGDVFLVQEMLFGNNTDAAFNTFARQVCGEECEAYRGTGDLIPNGVVSRFPIVDAGVWDDPETDTREFAWARIDVPGRPDLWAVSVHLLTSSGSAREAEARALAEHISLNVPDVDHVVVGGDFNTGGGGAYDRLRGVVRIPPAPPRDQAGNINTNAPRSRILDGVLVSRALDQREVPVVMGGESFPAGLIVDTRVFTPIEALAPALIGDSGANMMQHMAIVRDFRFFGL